MFWQAKTQERQQLPIGGLLLFYAGKEGFASREPFAAMPDGRAQGRAYGLLPSAALCALQIGGRRLASEWAKKNERKGWCRYVQKFMAGFF